MASQSQDLLMLVSVTSILFHLPLLTTLHLTLPSSRSALPIKSSSSEMSNSDPNLPTSLFSSLRRKILKFDQALPPFNHPSFFLASLPSLLQLRSNYPLTSVLSAFALIPSVTLVLILYNSELSTTCFPVSDNQDFKQIRLNDLADESIKNDAFQFQQLPSISLVQTSSLKHILERW